MKSPKSLEDPNSKADGMAKVILLSEPDPSILRPVLGLLQGDGHVVLQALDFPATLKHIHETGTEFDLAVMNTNLVLQDGKNLMEMLHSVNSGIHMLVISHFGATLPRIDIDDMRHIRILRKPFEPVMVRTRVRELFGNGEGNKPTTGGSERRAFRRSPINQRNALRTPGGAIFPVVDVSSGGFAVLTDHEFSSGHNIDFSFKMISGFATVIRSSLYQGVGPFRSNNYLVQCRFGETMHPADVEVLLDLLQ